MYLLLKLIKQNYFFKTEYILSELKKCSKNDKKLQPLN